MSSMQHVTRPLRISFILNALLILARHRRHYHDGIAIEVNFVARKPDIPRWIEARRLVDVFCAGTGRSGQRNRHENGESRADERPLELCLEMFGTPGP
jgi:hypothetical protein